VAVFAVVASAVYVGGGDRQVLGDEVQQVFVLDSSSARRGSSPVVRVDVIAAGAVQ
jgi:hypothetical protein